MYVYTRPPYSSEGPTKYQPTMSGRVQRVLPCFQSIVPYALSPQSPSCFQRVLHSYHALDLTFLFTIDPNRSYYREMSLRISRLAINLKIFERILTNWRSKIWPSCSHAKRTSCWTENGSHLLYINLNCYLIVYVGLVVSGEIYLFVYIRFVYVRTFVYIMVYSTVDVDTQYIATVREHVYSMGNSISI